MAVDKKTSDFVPVTSVDDFSLIELSIPDGGGGFDSNSITKQNLFEQIRDRLGDWSSTISYDSDDMVAFGGSIYKSLVGSNLNNIPSSSPSEWEIYMTGAAIKTAYEAEADTNAFTDAEKTKLTGIEALADVTDATNVNAAGATMNADTTMAGNGYFLDEDNFASDDDTKVASQQSIKAFVESTVASSINYKGGYDAATNTPDLDTSPSGVIIGDMYTVTVAGTFFTIGVEVGDVLIAEITNAVAEADWTIVQTNLDAASIKVLYESNADTNAFTDSEQSKLSGIESGATADQSDAEIETAYNNQVAQVSAGEKTAGTELNLRTYAPKDIADMAGTHGGGGAGVPTNLSWTFSSTTTDADPGPGIFRLNNATMSLVTKMFIDDLSANGADATTVIELLSTGVQIYTGQDDDATAGALFEVTGTPIDNSGYFTIPLVHVDDSTTGLTNTDTYGFQIVGSAGSGQGGPTTIVARQRLGRTILSGVQTTISFSSIDQTFDRLSIVGVARTDEAAITDSGVNITFNTDTTATNYRTANNIVTGGTIFTTEQANTRMPMTVCGAGATANAFGNFRIEIEDYAGSHIKQLQARWTTIRTVGSDLQLGLRDVIWNDTSAITQIDLTVTSGDDFIADSIFELWGEKAITIGGGNDLEDKEFVIAVSDEDTDLTTGVAKTTFRIPVGMTVTEVRASVNTAPTGADIIVDINKSGTTILSTKLSIDATEKTSVTAAVPAVISDAILADDEEITVDIDQIGSTIAGTGLKITIIGTTGTVQDEIAVSASDESTDLTTGTAKVTFRMPYAMTLIAVRASVNTAPTGSTITVDINEAGVSVLSTVISIDASEKTSVTAATPPVISDSALADDAEITIDIDQIGSTIAGKGLKIVLIGTRV